MSEPSPYAILVTCLQKNYGLGDTNIQTTMTPARNQRNEFKMKVNQREVSYYLGQWFSTQTAPQLVFLIYFSTVHKWSISDNFRVIKLILKTYFLGLVWVFVFFSRLSCSPRLYSPVEIGSSRRWATFTKCSKLYKWICRHICVTSRTSVHTKKHDGTVNFCRISCKVHYFPVHESI